MSDHVESMMYIGQIPWHGKGNYVDENDSYSIEKCIQAAGLDWEVSLRQCSAFIEEEDDYIIVPGCNVTTRKLPDGKIQILGTVRDRYTVIQNIEAFTVFQPFLDAKTVRLHAAGSLFEGQKIWVLAEIMGEALHITETEIVRKFLLLSHGHDGQSIVRFGFTPIRTICFNTLCMAHESNLSKLIRMRHTKNVHNNLENVREVIDLVNQDFKATQEQYQRLLKTEISQVDVEKYIKQVFDYNGDDISTRSYNMIQKIKSYFYMSPGNEEKGVRGTLYAAYNAITYYLTHIYGRNAENRLDANWFGKNTETNKRALKIALDDFSNERE
jgi:phage/plasmid-like protein (TIGR03299 family)